jgi:hypothetical protein
MIGVGVGDGGRGSGVGISPTFLAKYFSGKGHQFFSLKNRRLLATHQGFHIFVVRPMRKPENFEDSLPE